MRATVTGIGRALRKAREVRGKSLEEASRETRIRSEYLHALERESFEGLIGDVYVRGFLRSYSSYLGLDPEKVLGVFNRAHGRHRPTTPPVAAVSKVAPDATGHPLIHRPSRWGVAVGFGVAALVGVAALAIATRATAPADTPSTPVFSVPVQTPPVVAEVTAVVAADQVVIVVDGVTEYEGPLREGEARRFEGTRSIELSVPGGAVVLEVNGHDLGLAGVTGEPYDASFGPQDFRESPSSSGG